MAETWRVVLATGEVREVRVSFEPYPGAVNDEPCQYVARCDDAEAESTASAHDAALWLASCHEWVAVEILAPGELTRAELLAQVEAYAAQLAPMTRAVDALRAAAVAAGHPAADGDPDAQFCAVRAAAWSAGAEAMRRDAMRACSAIEDKRTEDAQWRRTHGSRATRDEDYHRLFGQAIGADACWDAIRAIPVPPCPEVPR